MGTDGRDKMLAAMFRVRPELARVAEKDETRVAETAVDAGSLYVTEAALQKKREEYERLVNELIPENAADIGRAASHGDLSENAEWAAAVERQGQLGKLAQEMSADLDRVRIIDSSMQDGESVSLGSRVRISKADGEMIDYTILGPWEVSAERHIISYLSPLGSAFIGKHVGDMTEVELPAGTVAYTIEDIGNGLETPSESKTS